MPNTSGPRRVEVVDLLPVDRAVAGVVEVGAGSELLRLERRGGGDHLERRAGDVQPRARAVDERGCRRAVGRDARDAAEVILDDIRVEARRRRHDQDLPGSRVERDDRAAVLSELLVCHRLGVEIERGDDVVPPHRPAVQLVERPVDEGREVRVRGRQVVVERALEAGSRTAHRRIADDVCRKRSVRVAAEVERLPFDFALPVPRQALPGLEREDQPAVDRELVHASDRVVLTSGEAGGAHVCQ